jgi:hypothetical protein
MTQEELSVASLLNTGVRPMTEREKEQGWYDFGCECGHAYIFRASIIRTLPLSAITFCPAASQPLALKSFLEAKS